MSIVEKLGLWGFFLPLLLVGFISCGTNNDQGTSFTGLGFFFEGGASQDAGAVVLLNESIEGSQGTPLFVPSASADGRDGGFVGLRNNLTDQFIRTVRIDCDHFIPGADPLLDIPSDAWNFTTIVDPGGTAFVQVQIVSPDVIQFISVNFNLLPELPFRQTALCTVTGVTQAGDTITTNEISYQIQWAERPECCTGTGAGGGGGFQGGPGVGGDIATFGDAEPEDIESDTGVELGTTGDTTS